MRYWLDTEFIENGSTIDLVSVGIVAEDGRELYLQLHDANFPSAKDWVWRNVFPHLEHFDFHLRGRSCAPPRADDFDRKGARCCDKDCPWRYRVEARELVREFCNPEKYDTPEFWGYYADYDWVAICQLFGAMIDLPKGWPMYCRDIKQLCDDLGNPTLPQNGKDVHNALADARWNREAWEFLQLLAANRRLAATHAPA